MAPTWESVSTDYLAGVRHSRGSSVRAPKLHHFPHKVDADMEVFLEDILLKVLKGW